MPTQQTTSSFVVPMTNVVTVKLNSENYLIWKAQLVPYFCGQDLFGYLNGTATLPLQTISTSHPDSGTISEIPNLAYSHWVRQDNIILSTLMSSLFEGVLAQVVNYTTSHVVWHAFDENFSSRSRAKTVQIRTQLATDTKGQPMTWEDVITYVLAGLGHEYDSFVASISAWTNMISLEEIYSLLLTTKACISWHQLASPFQQASLNVAQEQFQQFTTRGRGGYLGKGRAQRGGYHNNTRSNNLPSLICQVCNKPGHSTRKCYHRFDLSYQDSIKTKNKQAIGSIQWCKLGKRLACRLRSYSPCHKRHQQSESQP
ncbi:hypothetical protein F2P56_007677 [Juglans regia]|uniref:Retrotransposon Copia-like N-terminal domain-containing protein n=1 Tax=Juglans regia TaxID=51240 RepID=A0A833XRR9_JUGRE|nr:hypothetical protein F2P56_007677 [Juglans regia]